MDNENVTVLAASRESETLEFKETTGTRREATMTVCAFLNQGGRTGVVRGDPGRGRSRPAGQ